MRHTPETFAAALKDTLGRRLTSVILYGSAASGDHMARLSDFNILIVLDRTDPGILSRLGPTLRAWTKRGNPLPQIMDRRFLARSADVFPLEWADMKDFHQVLHGVDVLTTVRITPGSLRNELERELKAKILRLRAAYAEAADQPARLQQLLIASGSTFQVLFRGILRLKRIKPLPAKREAAAALGRLLRLDLSVFGIIDRMRTGDRVAWRAPVGTTTQNYLKAVEAVTNIVDSWT